MITFRPVFLQLEMGIRNGRPFPFPPIQFPSMTKLQIQWIYPDESVMHAKSMTAADDRFVGVFSNSTDYAGIANAGERPSTLVVWLTLHFGISGAQGLAFVLSPPDHTTSHSTLLSLSRTSFFSKFFLRFARLISKMAHSNLTIVNFLK